MGVACFIVEALAYYGIGMKEYIEEEILQSMVFAVMGFIFFINSYIRGRKKPTKYEKKNVFEVSSYMQEEEDFVQEESQYDENIVISTQSLSFDDASIQTNMDIESIEQKIFVDICEMMRECTKKYPSIHYAVTLERGIALESQSYGLIKRYDSQVSVYLSRNHIVLERKKDEGEWPGAFSEIIKVRRQTPVINKKYREDILENIEWTSQVYLEDSETHYENKEESDSILSNVVKVEWIDAQG